MVGWRRETTTLHAAVGFDSWNWVGPSSRHIHKRSFHIHTRHNRRPVVLTRRLPRPRHPRTHRRPSALSPKIPALSPVDGPVPLVVGHDARVKRGELEVLRTLCLSRSPHWPFLGERMVLRGARPRKRFNVTSPTVFVSWHCPALNPDVFVVPRCPISMCPDPPSRHQRGDSHRVHPPSDGRREVVARLVGGGAVALARARRPQRPPQRALQRPLRAALHSRLCRAGRRPGHVLIAAAAISAAPEARGEHHRRSPRGHRARRRPAVAGALVGARF